MLRTTHISSSINRPANDVYTFAANPANLPQWAAGLSGSTIKQVDDKWIAESPMGTVSIHFVPHNDFGIMDHYVTIPSGQVFYNPLRVFPNQDGSEVVFTLFRQPEMSDEQFEIDVTYITSDLARLKAILEVK